MKPQTNYIQFNGHKYNVPNVIKDVMLLVTDVNFYEPINEETYIRYTRFNSPPNLAVSLMIRQRLAHAFWKVLGLTEEQIKSILYIISNTQIWVQTKDITFVTVLNAIKETTTYELVLQYLQLFLKEHNHKVSQENYQKYKNTKHYY